MVDGLIEEIHRALGVTSDVDVTLGLFAQLELASTPEDAPKLLAALKREEKNFWGLEMFGQILCNFDNPDLLEPLLIAIDQIWDMGHDGDGLQAALGFLAESKPGPSLAVLQKLRKQRPPNISSETIDWLTEYCATP